MKRLPITVILEKLASDRKYKKKNQDTKCAQRIVLGVEISIWIPTFAKIFLIYIELFTHQKKEK